jgi:hypothetical protein
MEREREMLERQYTEEYELRLSEHLHKALTHSPCLYESAEDIDDEELADHEHAEEEEGEGAEGGEEKETTISQEEQTTTQLELKSSGERKEEKGDQSRKHLFLTRSYHIQDHDGAHDQEDVEYYLHLCEKVRRNEEKADFVIIILIRLLYLLKKRAQAEGRGDDGRISRLVSDFNDFSFWTTSKHKSGQMPSVIFWSENHTFMYLSTAYLLHQFLPSENLKHQPMALSEKEATLLEIYLDAHCHEKFQGVYEVLSATYLPYTLCSLLNLYDFAENPKIRYQAKEMIDRIVCSFTLVANRSGICNLTASARQYSHTRLRNYGHNINQLFYLVTGVSIDNFKPTSIVDFLLTSSWRPPLEAIRNFMLPEQYLLRSLESPQERSNSPDGYFLSLKKMNHSTKDIRKIYEEACKAHNLKKGQLTPFYW